MTHALFSDSMADNRMVLAKGAGPGIYNRWDACCGGRRYFLAHVRWEYTL